MVAQGVEVAIWVPVAEGAWIAQAQMAHTVAAEMAAPGTALPFGKAPQKCLAAVEVGAAEIAADLISAIAREPGDLVAVETGV